MQIVILISIKKTSETLCPYQTLPFNRGSQGKLGISGENYVTAGIMWDPPASRSRSARVHTKQHHHHQRTSGSGRV